MARRPSGQIEEEPVGFSIVAVDGRCVSWRLGAWPEKGILGTPLGPNRNGHGG